MTRGPGMMIIMDTGPAGGILQAEGGCAWTNASSSTWT
jgi:hypothetical protein